MVSPIKLEKVFPRRIFDAFSFSKKKELAINFDFDGTPISNRIEKKKKVVRVFHNLTFESSVETEAKPQQAN